MADVADFSVDLQNELQARENESATPPQITSTRVMLHGYEDLPCGGQEHRDSNFEFDQCTGFNVWVRVDYDTPNEYGEPFGALDEHDRDFETIEQAREYAEQLAEQLKCEIEEY